MFKWTTLILAIAIWAAGAAADEPSRERSRIAARVNDEVITWSDVDQEIKVTGSKNEELRKSVLRQMAERRLFLQEAKQLSLTVGEEEVDKAIEKEVKSFGSREKMLDYLRFIGVTSSAYRESKREAALINSLIMHKYHQLQDLVTNTYPSPQEIREYYDGHLPQFKGRDEVSIRRLTLAFENEQQKEIKRREAESILRRIKEGGSFPFLAAYHDETEQHGAPQSGVRRDNKAISPAVIATAFDKLKPGEISGIVEDARSFTIVALEGRDYQQELTYDEAQLIIRKIIQNQKWAENRLRLRNELLKKTYYEPADLFD